MKVKKTIKKIVALGVGASMIGATLLGATAADLADFPSPFVKDGTFDGMMVVGDDAAPADIIGVTDIAMSLQFSSSVTRTVNIAGASGVALSGDAAEVGEPNDLLELYEQLGDVKETFTDADLEALQSGVVSTDKGTTDYNQYLRLEETGFPSATDTNYVVYSEDEDEEVGDFLFFEDGEVMFEYELEFEEGFESDITDSSGDGADCGDLEDLEDEVLHILGSSYAVINADVSATDALCTDDDDEAVVLELMAGDVTDTLEEGETKTYNIDGKDYEVTLIIVSDSLSPPESKFKINGEVTDELSDGDTDVLNDGTEIGIRSILPNEAGETAGGDIVEFYLGASKLELTDNDVTDESFTSSNTVEINEENIEAAQLVIRAGSAGGTQTYRVNSIKYRLEADASSGDVFVPPGHGVREYLDEPEGMLSLNWDIRYEGLMETGTTEMKLDPAGDDEYRLKFTNLQGQEYSFTVLEADGSGGSSFVAGQDKGTDGSDGGGGTPTEANASDHYDPDTNEDELWIYDDDWHIAEDDYFTVTESGATSGIADEKSFSSVLRFQSIDTDSKVVTFSDLSGGTKTATYAEESGTFTGELIVSGNSFDFWVLSDGEATASVGERTTSFNTSTLAVIDVDQDGNGATGGVQDAVKLVTEGGALLDWSTPALLTGETCTDDYVLLITTLGGEFDEGSDGASLTADNGDETIEICLDGAAGTSADEVDASVQALFDNTTDEGLTLHQLSDNDDVKQGMTRYGTFVKELDDANDADTITIEYPLTQRGAQVFITAGETSSASTGSGGALTYEEPVRIEIGSAMLASKVADPTSTNVISVGGSCINSVTASLLGLSYPACGEASGLAEGEAVLKLVESGSNVAIVVAGWNADDTTRATRVLADYGKWQDAGKLTGSEVKVTGTSLTNFDVTPAE